MNKKSNTTEEFIPPHTNNLRLELQGKIDKKLDNKVFYTFLTIIVPLIGVIFLAFWYGNEKIHDINDKLIIIDNKHPHTK